MMGDLNDNGGAYIARVLGVLRAGKRIVSPNEDGSGWDITKRISII